MLTLGIDSSGLLLTVALCRTGEVVASRSVEQRRQQGEVLLALVDECLVQAKSELGDLAALAVVTGPGSFTGLRLGIAASLGLARSLNCALTGYDRFTLLRTPETALVFESLRADVFVQIPGHEPQMLLPADILSRWPGAVAGDGVAKLMALDPARPVAPLPLAAELAAQKVYADLQAKRELPPATPYYLRAPDVTFPAAL